MDLEKLIWPGAASLGGTEITKGSHLNMPVSADWSSCSEHCVEDSEPASACGNRSAVVTKRVGAST